MKKRILFLAPALNGGGAERALINLFEKIDFDKYEIDLLLVLKQGVYLNKIPKEVNMIYLFKSARLNRILRYLQKKNRIFIVF